MWRRLIVAAAMVLAFALPAQADSVNVRGVELPNQIELGGEQLLLNGAGVRQRLMFRVYVGSLYLPERSSDVQAILDMDGPKRIQMNLLRNIDQSTLAEAMTDGFESNLSAADRQRFAAEIRQFASMLDEGRNGDEVRLDYIPGEGLRVTHGGRDKGLIEGDDFHRAVLKLWLGDEPADERLKQGMLGG